MLKLTLVRDPQVSSLVVKVNRHPNEQNEIATVTTKYNRIIDQCRQAIQSKYNRGRQFQARPFFEAERSIIEEHGFQPALIKAVEFAEKLKQAGRRTHLIGSGCSSFVTYLLGLSEVDPIRYRTQFSRLWFTSNGQPPRFQFVVTPGEDKSSESQVADGITAHPMTRLELIPIFLEKLLLPVDIRWSDKVTFEAINAGDTESVFQLETEPLRLLIARLRPGQIKDLATATALDLVQCSQPAEVEAFLKQQEGWVPRRQFPKKERQAAARQLSRCIFQESIAAQIRHRTGLSWDDTYRFLQLAARGNMSDMHPLWCMAVEGAHSRNHTENEATLALKGLTEAARWAVCRAHHAANAITSYKAAYYRTHHRAEFEAAVRQVTSFN